MSEPKKIPVTDIETHNPYYIRGVVTVSLELLESIKTLGIINPIDVRPLPNGKYQLVNGRLRFEAAKKLKMSEVPCIVSNITDQEIIEMNLLRSVDPLTGQ